MLPKEKTKPKADIQDMTILIYGPSKIGKTTFCSHAEGALFLATERGHDHLECAVTPITSWANEGDPTSFARTVKELREEEHPYRTLIIDTVDNLYRLCEEHICLKHKIDHVSDLEYGKGYGLVNNEFHRVLSGLSRMNNKGGQKFGLWMISHSQDKEFTTRTGKLTRTIPTLGEKARKLVLGIVDFILFCDIDRTTGKPMRVIRTKPTQEYDAGDRTGKLPEMIPLQYTSFLEAFNATRNTTITAVKVA